MHLYPLRHSAHFAEIKPDETRALAGAVKAVLSKLKSLLSDPPYNIVLHQTPNPAVSEGNWPAIRKAYHWHLEILPVLTRVAGFELGTGFYINPVPPETAAEFLSGQRVT